MKKKSNWLFLFSVIAVLSMAIVANAEVDSEIRFKDIPWGTSFTEVKENLIPEWSWDSLHGDWMRVLSINDIVNDSYDEFENNDLCINTYTIDEVEVAGYTSSQTSMYYAYIPSNGVLTREESDTSLYAAEYDIEPTDIDSAFDDLLEKLKSVYGEPDGSKTYKIFLSTEITIYYWNGSNDTMLSLKKEPYEDDNHIHIIYTWGNGDKMLHDADEIASGEKTKEESSIYGNENTEGL